jgi:hypothetical protein
MVGKLKSSSRGKTNTDGGGDYYKAESDQAVVLLPESGHQGQRFFGCCCDMRRAVVIVNLLHVISSLFEIAIIKIVTRDNFISEHDDDFVKYELYTVGENARSTIMLGFLAIAFAAIGIYGAANFKQPMVMVAAGWYVVDFIMSLFRKDFAGAFMAGLFIYPHYSFIQEQSKGTMTQENYPNEIYSCCCV